MTQVAECDQLLQVLVAGNVQLLVAGCDQLLQLLEVTGGDQLLQVVHDERHQVVRVDDGLEGDTPDDALVSQGLHIDCVTRRYNEQCLVMARVMPRVMPSNALINVE